MGQRILRRTLEWQKNAGEEKNVGFFLKIYLRKNLVLIKKSLHIGPRILRTDTW